MAWVRSVGSFQRLGRSSQKPWCAHLRLSGPIKASHGSKPTPSSPSRRTGEYIHARKELKRMPWRTAQPGERIVFLLGLALLSISPSLVFKQGWLTILHTSSCTVGNDLCNVRSYRGWSGSHGECISQEIRFAVRRSSLHVGKRVGPGWWLCNLCKRTPIPAVLSKSHPY
jgi:hypothetical protein